MCWNYSVALPNLNKGTLICGWLSKLACFGGKTIENFYSSILLVASCCILHFVMQIAKPSNFLEESKFHFNVMDIYGFCAVLCNTDLGSEFLVLGNTLGILLKNITLLFSLWYWYTCHIQAGPMINLNVQVFLTEARCLNLLHSMQSVLILINCHQE